MSKKQRELLFALIIWENVRVKGKIALFWLNSQLIETHEVRETVYFSALSEFYKLQFLIGWCCVICLRKVRDVWRHIMFAWCFTVICSPEVLCTFGSKIYLGCRRLWVASAKSKRTYEIHALRETRRRLGSKMLPSHRMSSEPRARTTDVFHLVRVYG